MPRDDRLPFIVPPKLAKPVARRPDTAVQLSHQGPVPGVRHIIEGSPQGLTLMGNPLRNFAGPQDNDNYQQDRTAYTRSLVETREHNESVNAQVDVFNQEQEARKRIKSIVDPDDIFLRAERQRAAARRRMRGRIGTILTDRDNLGGSGAQL